MAWTLWTSAGALLAIVMWAAPAQGALIQGLQLTGNLDLEVAAASNLAGALPTFSGSVTLSNVLPGPVQKATVYTNDWASSGNLDLTFNSVSVGLAAPFQSDTTSIITHLFAYQWDVTALVTAPGTYSIAIGQGSPGNQIYGAALLVVWQDPLAPSRTITVIDGARQVGESGPETESASYTGLPAGATTLWVFTVADDSVNSGEVVSYNGTQVGGPIDENLGLGASLLQLGATSVAGANTVAITTTGDHFGWLLAATNVQATAVVAQPPTLLLGILGGLVLLAAGAVGPRHEASAATGTQLGGI